MKQSIFLLMLCALLACETEPMLHSKENELKRLLHQKRWHLRAMYADKPRNYQGIFSRDWLLQIEHCHKDNIFITEAPGTGAVGEMHAEEGATTCHPNDLFYQHHIAGWTLNDTQDVFFITLFDTGHRMLYGYASEESYTEENWVIEQLDPQTLQVKVDKIFAHETYELTLHFEAIP